MTTTLCERSDLMAETQTETGTESGKETETAARPDKPQQLCPLLFKFFA